MKAPLNFIKDKTTFLRKYINFFVKNMICLDKIG